MVPAEDVYAFHVALIKHGRHTCTARAPNCADCPLNDVCPSAFRVNNAKPGTANAAARGTTS
jgi:endonuclease III